MTPSEERKIKKEIKDLFDENARLDAAQEKEIADLKRRVKKLEKLVKGDGKDDDAIKIPKFTRYEKPIGASKQPQKD